MRRHVAALLVVLSACALFQAWFLGLTPHGVKLGDPKLSNAYTEALAHGQSYLLATPDPRLVAAKDPFGPATAALMVLDTSFFRGHFYIYFGIVPFVTFLVPWRLATGVPPSPELTLIVFSFLGYAAYSTILLLAVKRWYQRSSWLVTGMAGLTLVVASGTWPLMGRPAIYELENAAAYAFFGLSLLALTRFEWGEDHPLWALTASTACAALVMGCRPNYFPAVAVLGTWAAYRCLQRIKCKGAHSIAPALSMAAIGVGLAWWNFHRFGDVFDFGLKHTVSEDPTQTRSLSTLANLRYGFHRYTVGLPRIGKYFPFIQGQADGPFPPAPKQELSNQVYGFLLITPAVLFAIPGLFCASRLGRLSRLCYVCIAGFAGNLLFLSCLTMSCYRYPADFLGPLALVSAVGILTITNSPISVRRIILPTCVAVVGASFLGVLFETFSIAQNSEAFDLQRPEAFKIAESIFDGPRNAYEHFARREPRSIKIACLFPKDQNGRSEPLLVTGENGAQNFFYVYYAGPGIIRIGYEVEGLGGNLSHPIDCDYLLAHTIEFCLGTSLPPSSSPALSQVDPTLISHARNTVLLKFDGQIVMDQESALHPERARELIGQSPLNSAFGAKFSGRIISVSRPFMPVPISTAASNFAEYGPVMLQTQLASLPDSVLEPIFSVGYQNNGAQLLIEHVGPERVRLVWATTSGFREKNPVFSWTPGIRREITLSCGSLYPPLASELWPKGLSAARKSEMKNRLLVSIGGSIKWDTQVPSPDASPASRAYGKDVLSIVPNTMPSAAEVTLSRSDPSWFQRPRVEP